MTLQPLAQLDDAWAVSAPGSRLQAVERAAPALRESIAASGVVRAVRTFPTAVFPYPTRYAFNDACSLPLKYVWMRNRALLIEYDDHDGERRRLLANPTSAEGSRKAPYFRDLLRSTPGLLEPLLGRTFPDLPDQLIQAGVDPGSIDYLTFDHLHVQDVAPMLGPSGSYPKARLLVTATEHQTVRNLHPLQAYWYVAGTMRDVQPDNVIEFDRDVSMGRGLALVRTPGHTEGNHSIVFNLPEGLVTVSENGVCRDSYAPAHSNIPGIRAHHDRTGARVLINSNSRERTLDQYTSMRLEALLSAPPDGGPIPRHFCSSELTTFPLAPGIRPTHPFADISHGRLAAC